MGYNFNQIGSSAVDYATNQNRYWKAAPNSVIRFLPSIDPKAHDPRSPEAQRDSIMVVGAHYVPVGFSDSGAPSADNTRKVRVLCPHSTYSLSMSLDEITAYSAKPCPICARVRELYANENDAVRALAGKMRASVSFAMNILDISKTSAYGQSQAQLTMDDLVSGLTIWEMNKTTFNASLSNWLKGNGPSPNAINAFDLSNGFLVRVDVTGTGFQRKTSLVPLSGAFPVPLELITAHARYLREIYSDEAVKKSQENVADVMQQFETFYQSTLARSRGAMHAMPGLGNPAPYGVPANPYATSAPTVQPQFQPQFQPQPQPQYQAPQYAPQPQLSPQPQPTVQSQYPPQPQYQAPQYAPQPQAQAQPQTDVHGYPVDAMSAQQAPAQYDAYGYPANAQQPQQPQQQQPQSLRADLPGGSFSDLIDQAVEEG